MCWRKLINELNSDPWGFGYKIVTQRLRAFAKEPARDAYTMEGIVSALFPSHPVRRDTNTWEVVQDEIPWFNEEELTHAVNSFANRKSPGPDGIPADVLKAIVKHHPQVLLKLYNRCLKEGIFPRQWKMQRLVLINKGMGDPSSPSSYRPLCMLDTSGKLLEKLLKPRLQSAIRAAGDLSRRQYSFRKGRSTIDLVQEVVAAVSVTQQGHHFSRRIALLVTRNVKNAFNSVRWNNMLKALRVKFKVPHYLLRMIDN